jgi:hypothetical protein
MRPVTNISTFITSTLLYKYSIYLSLYLVVIYNKLGNTICDTLQSIVPNHSLDFSILIFMFPIKFLTVCIHLGIHRSIDLSILYL